MAPESLRALRGRVSHDRGAPPGERRMVARITSMTIVVLGIWVATVGLFLSLFGLWVGAHERNLRTESARGSYSEAWRPEAKELPVEVLPELSFTLVGDRARCVPDPCEGFEVSSEEGGDGQ